MLASSHRNEHPLVIVIMGSIGILLGGGFWWLLYVTKDAPRLQASASSRESKADTAVNRALMWVAPTMLSGMGTFLLILGIVRLH